MSLREVGKTRRRRRILDAARTLIESGGEESFAIKPVADAAELSVATIYNLFGSKEGLLVALLMESVLSFEKRLDELAPATPIDRVGAISALAVSEFTSEARFYRPLLHLIEQMGSRTQLLGVIRHCVDLGHEAIGWAIETGDIQAVVEPRVLAHQIFMAFIHALRMLSSGLSSSELFEAQVVHFRTLMLAAVANEPLRSKLHEQLRTLNTPMLKLADLDPDRIGSELEASPTTIKQGATR